MILPKIIVILGPTASGKSALAVEIAKKFNGEIISADSRQVYKGLDIGTGKITKKEMGGIRHHLLDVVSSKKTFSVANFKILAEKAIEEILTRKKLPIICGGTGFYIQALTENTSLPDVPPNPKLRKKLEKKSCEFLIKQLGKFDPQFAKKIDKNNKRKIIRAIEIAETLGKIPEIKSAPKYHSLQIGIKTDKEILKNKIHARLIRRIRLGMIDEAKKLHNSGLSLKKMDSFGLEYRFLAKFLQKKISKEEMIEKLNTAIWQYARRQITWFKRDKKIKWFEISDKNKIVIEIKKFLR